jgi:hypothetical protein
MQRIEVLIFTALLAAPFPALAGPKSYAQQLIEAARSSHHEVSALSVYATDPKTHATRLAASTAPGAPTAPSAADLKTIESGEPVASRAGSAGWRVRTPLYDMSGRTLGELVVVVKGESQAQALLTADSVRTEMARRISHISNLLEPARFDPTTPVNSYAQSLVDRVLAEHPGVIIVALHATPPKSPANVIVGSNIGRIGKKADEDDLEVIKTGASKLELNGTGDRFEIEQQLKDVSGDVIGAVGVVWPYKAGDDKAAHQKEADEINAWLAHRISNPANLVEPYPYDPAVSTDTYAQSLVDRTMAAHPEVIILAMHVTPPHGKANIILASNIGRIGKKADEDDLRVVNAAAVNQEVNADGKRFEVELPLKNDAGAQIGALSVVFAYHAPDDKPALYERAVKIRDEVAAEIPGVAALVKPR